MDTLVLTAIGLCDQLNKNCEFSEVFRISLEIPQWTEVKALEIYLRRRLRSRYGLGEAMLRIRIQQHESQQWLWLAHASGSKKPEQSEISLQKTLRNDLNNTFYIVYTSTCLIDELWILNIC
jgi:hypothetical protein